MIVYIHGFNSGFNPDSHKAKGLETIDKVIGLNYNSFDTHENILLDLTRKLDKIEDVTLIVGTSLGGYFALVLAKHFDLPSVVINPAVAPYEYLANLVGSTFENHAYDSTNTLSHKVARSYKDKEIENELSEYHYTPMLLVDYGDELFDSTRTLERLNAFSAIAYKGGDHRFAHIKEALPFIESYVNTCSFVTNINHD